MNVNAFDSKQRFIESLRMAYGAGTFFLGTKVSSSTALSYYTQLKEDYERNEIARRYSEPEYMGFQGDNYWIISNDVRSNITFSSAAKLVSHWSQESGMASSGRCDWVDSIPLQDCSIFIHISQKEKIPDSCDKCKPGFNILSTIYMHICIFCMKLPNSKFTMTIAGYKTQCNTYFNIHSFKNYDEA